MGKVLLIILFSFTYSFDAFSMTVDEKIEIAKTRCAPFKDSDPLLYMTDYKSGQSAERMEETYKNTYEGEGRLPQRVGYYEETNSFSTRIGTLNQGDFPEAYIKSVIKQVENLLRLNYVKYIYYSDMGHSHFFIPMTYYNEFIKDKGYRATKSASLAMLSKGLKTLYHTAEQLGVRDFETKELYVDTYLQWRFYTRNPVVDFNANIEILTDFSGLGNTVRAYFPAEEQYKYFAGFYISANKNGCFPFENKEGEINYFDLSFDGPAYILGEGENTGFNKPHLNEPDPLKEFGWDFDDHFRSEQFSHELINH